MSKWSWIHTGVLFLVLAGLALASLYLPVEDGGDERVVAWVVFVSAILLFTLVAGHGVHRRWRGALIDETNKMSLSRLQLFLWTIVIVSALLTAAVINLRSGKTVPLDITVPDELWVLLGISTTSLAGAPLIRSTKMNQSANEAQENATKSLLGEQGYAIGEVRSVGQIMVNSDPKNATWANLFMGEEVGNAAQLDLGKIQMFFFTLIIVVVYTIALGNQFLASGTDSLDALPELDGGIVTLLGISHAAYLVHKGVPHSKTGGAEQGVSPPSSGVSR